MSVDTPPVRRWRLLTRWQVHEYQLVEVHQLDEHISARLENLTASDSNIYNDWLKSEFTYPLRGLLLRSARSQTVHVVLNLMIVAGGFAISGIAVAAGSGGKGSLTSWIVFVIGLLLAVMGAVNQLTKPGERSTEAAAIAVAFREQGWLFALQRGDYSGDTASAFDTFRQRITGFQRQLAKLEEDKTPLNSSNSKAED